MWLGYKICVRSGFFRGQFRNFNSCLNSIISESDDCLLYCMYDL